MSSNKHAQIRYKVLDDCFSNFRRKFYFDDLMERCNDALKELYGEEHQSIGVRTLRADISYMRERAGEYGVEIMTIDDGTGFYYRYSEKKFSIFQHGLSDSDKTQLKETLLMLQSFKGIQNLDWINEIIVKFEDKLNLRGTEHHVVSYDENEDYTGLEWFQDIFDAIIGKIVLRIKYTTFSWQTFEWTIHPYYLKEYNNRWFLFGFNEEEDRIYNIALDRIDNIEQIKKAFKPSDTDFETYFDDIVGVTVLDKPKETIRLRFSEHRFPYVMTKALHKTQKIIDVNERIIEITVIPNLELEALILNYGKDVEVLAPDSFKNRIMNIIKDNYEIYWGSQIQTD